MIWCQTSTHDQQRCVLVWEKTCVSSRKSQFEHSDRISKKKKRHTQTEKDIFSVFVLTHRFYFLRKFFFIFWFFLYFRRERFLFVFFIIVSLFFGGGGTFVYTFVLDVLSHSILVLSVVPQHISCRSDAGETFKADLHVK